MPKLNVYVSDELAAAIKDAGVPVSAVCQHALTDAVHQVAQARRAIEAFRQGEVAVEGVGRVSARMTPRLRTALQLAQAGSGPVGTAQLLGGVIDEGENLAVKLLLAMGLDPSSLLDRVTVVPSNEPAAADVAAAGADDDTAALLRRLTHPARSAVAAMMAVALDLGHNYLGCEHLLLGLVAEQQGAAGDVLRAGGVDERELRRRIEGAVTGVAHARQATATADDALRDVLRRLDALEQRLPLG